MTRVYMNYNSKRGHYCGVCLTIEFLQRGEENFVERVQKPKGLPLASPAKSEITTANLGFWELQFKNASKMTMGNKKRKGLKKKIKNKS